MRIAILGPTGVLGQQVIPRLIERGHEVRAVVLREPDGVFLERIGVDAVLGNILDATTLPKAIEGCGAVLHLATAIPRPDGPRDWTLNDRIRREGTANLIAACHDVGVERYVQQSLAFLTGATASLLDETAPLLPPNAVTASAIDMETLVTASGLRWTILRDGALYGPRTGRDDGWRDLARKGELQLPGDGSDYISLVHVADLADAFVLAAEQAPAEVVLSVVDDCPTTYRELFTYLARLENGPDPRPGGGASLPSFRVSNARIRNVLGWQPRFPTYRSGLA